MSDHPIDWLIDWPFFNCFFQFFVFSAVFSKLPNASAWHWTFVVWKEFCNKINRSTSFLFDRDRSAAAASGAARGPCRGSDHALREKNCFTFSDFFRLFQTFTGFFIVDFFRWNTYVSFAGEARVAPLTAVTARGAALAVGIADAAFRLWFPTVITLKGKLHIKILYRYDSFCIQKNWTVHVFFGNSPGCDGSHQSVSAGGAAEETRQKSRFIGPPKFSSNGWKYILPSVYRGAPAGRAGTMRRTRFGRRTRHLWGVFGWWRGNYAWLMSRVQWTLPVFRENERKCRDESWSGGGAELSQATAKIWLASCQGGRRNFAWVFGQFRSWAEGAPFGQQPGTITAYLW